jgi:carbon-monoxide dehydrogenase medium subunit
VYPAQFDYYRANTLPEAHRLLAEHQGAKLLAGGHSLIPLLKLRLATPATLVDIGHIAELARIAVERETLRIGALATHAAIADSALVRSAAPMLAEAAGMIGDPAVRSRGTMGGNVAHADPASDLPPVLLALDARLSTASARERRTIAAADFFEGLMSTALAADEILLGVEIPVRRPGQGAAYVKFGHPASRYAVIGVAATLVASDGACSAASVALGGLVPKAIRATSVEVALVGKPLDAGTIAEASAAVAADLGDDLLGDVYASAEYRRAMAPVFVARALRTAAARVG